MKLSKRLFITSIAAVMSVTILAGCGEEKKDNVIPLGDGYDVALQEREDAEKYEYSLDDLSLVDTVSGKKISLGMTEAELEEIAGDAISINPSFKIYDGVIVQYTEDNKVGAMAVSSGEFREQEKAQRYLTTRGVGLYTSVDDFGVAYGEVKKEKDIPSNANRYFRVKGKKVEYLGEILSENYEDPENIYVQTFIFSQDNENIVAMRISNIDMMGR